MYLENDFYTKIIIFLTIQLKMINKMGTTYQKKL